MPAKFCRKSGSTGSRLPARHSAKFQGWEPSAPTQESSYDSQICVVKHTDLADPDTGMLSPEVTLRLKLYPEHVPELITLVVAERFSGVEMQAAIGRKATSVEAAQAYLPWLDINETGRWHNTPMSTFLPPSEDGGIYLRLRISGEEPPVSGLLYYFLKARKWHN